MCVSAVVDRRPVVEKGGKGAEEEGLLCACMSAKSLIIVGQMRKERAGEGVSWLWWLAH